MSGGAASVKSVNFEVQEVPPQENAPACDNPSETAARSPTQHVNSKEGNNRDGIGNWNVEEEEDEEEDVDFNPFLTEDHPVEAYSSLSSEVEDLDTDIDDNGRRKTRGGFVKKLNGKHNCVMKNSNAVGDVDHGEEIVMHSVSSGECGRNIDTSYAPITDREPVSVMESENGMLCDRDKGMSSLRDVVNDDALRRTVVDIDVDGAISMRTRARYSLANCTLDELETFLQETDDEDDLQNVDDEEEYRKFLTAVLQGDDCQSLQGNVNVDDEDENDADFELELEEALESDHDEIEERRKTRRNRRQKTSLERSSKHSGQSNRPLRPLLPFVPMGSCPGFEENQLARPYAPSYMPSANNGLGFTPHQIGQLHCLIHEHVQLLIQIFSVSVLDPGKGDVAADVKKLLIEMLKDRDQALQSRKLPYPRFCFFPPYIHPSVPDESHKMLAPHASNTNVQSVQEISSGSNGALHSNTIFSSNGRNNPHREEHATSSGTLESSSWVPYISGPVLSVTDVAPLRLVGSFIADVTSAVQAYKRYQIDVGVETDIEKQPLFPFHQDSCSDEPDSHGKVNSCSKNTSDKLAVLPRKQMSKAATMVEKAKRQSVALVPKEIAKLAERFMQFFNSALYPRKPPPALLVNRILFTDAEDELLAMGIMEYNTEWKTIQQRLLPCKSSHQIFVRQKNRTSSNAPENPIKAVRRMKTSPLTPEEVACIEVGMKRFKLDWISIWRFFLPYRDPSLLPRQWRIATGTQKSYKGDAAKNAKRRSSDMRRKANKSAPNRHSSSDKEGDSTDNAMEETNSGDNGMYKGDVAYVHEAFLADWRPDSNVSFGFPPHLSSQGGYQAYEQRDVAGTAPSSSKPSNRHVFLRPYRARKSKYTHLVKLAPDLPPVNLPPSVRVIPQSVFKTSNKVSVNAESIGGMVEENGALQVGSTMNSQTHNSPRSQHFRSGSLKVTAGDQQRQHGELFTGRCSTEERGESDLQMHPLLFQASQDAPLPYYPLNCGTTSFALFGDKQPQLNLSLFHNPRHIRDAVNFLSKSSKPPEKHPSSSNVDFHPLLHDGVDTNVVHPPASLPDGAKQRQRGAYGQNPSCSSLSKPSRDGSSSASGSRVATLIGEVNAVDLDIHLSSISENQEAMPNSSSRLDDTGRLLRSPDPRTKIFERANDSAADDSCQRIDSADLPLVASKNRGSRKVSEDMSDVSLPEIIMEQEELSDSEEEFGENVEFEHEEMTDSEGEDTSDSEQLLNAPDEEAQLDEMAEDIDNPQVSNKPFDRGGNVCSTTDDRHSDKSAVNNKPSSLSFNLNSDPPVSPLLNPEKTSTMYHFGPFGISSLSKTTPGTVHTLKPATAAAASGKHPISDSGRRPRKRTR